MSDKHYYQENFIKRGWKSVVDFFKGIPTVKTNATAGAIGFFVILVAMLEYKVFESMYGMTGDLILTASTLLVTAFGGVYAEVVLRRNDSATDDQNFWADAIVYISLGTSAFVGLGAWIQALGIVSFDLYFAVVSVPEFGQMAISIITLVTIADILILRAYFRGDVKAKHRRNIAQSNSKKTQADFEVEDSLIDFEAQVKAKTEQLLRVEARRREVKQELSAMYGGRVPDEIMTNAMQKLDEIMREIKTGEDLNRDGRVGLPPTKPQEAPRQAQFAQSASTPELTTVDAPKASPSTQPQNKN